MMIIMIVVVQEVALEADFAAVVVAKAGVSGMIVIISETETGTETGVLHLERDKVGPEALEVDMEVGET